MNPIRLLLVLTLLPTLAQAVPRYGVEVTEKLPLDRRYFTQGLEIHAGELFLSSGLWGESAVVVHAFPSLTVLRRTRIADRYFAEGLTHAGGHLLVLTWRAGALLVFDPDTLQQTGTGTIPGEGWGMTHDGDTVWFSDGTAWLHRFDVNTGHRLPSVEVRLDDRPVRRINELEWVEGEIWANVYLTDQILRISPETGAVTGIIDLTGLLPASERHPDTDVLNGIARDPDTGAIWVTGKRWPWLYRIELRPKD